MGSLTTKRPRVTTRFQTCERHAWLLQERRGRRAEFFIEGGPADQQGCAGGICRLWPGTDLFVADICGAEFPLPWTRLPLCADCIGAIGGACAGPDLPWRAAKPGEACGAADHDGIDAPPHDPHPACAVCVAREALALARGEEG